MPKKIKYTEPDSYFPKEIRDKYYGKKSAAKSSAKKTTAKKKGK